MNHFEYATRYKLRFPSAQGNLTVEQLWELPLITKNSSRASLDAVASAIYRTLKSADEVSFVKRQSDADEASEVALEVVKHIIQVRQTESKAAEQHLANVAKKAKLRALIEEKKDTDLGAKSIEELEKELASID